MKTSELQRNALNFAVAKCKGIEVHQDCSAPPYSTDWSFGGPIIELENINLKRGVNADGTVATTVEAECYRKGQDGWDRGRGEGETMLIAAMRCYVNLVVGDEIEVPF